jgi:hypothetical protein
VEANLPLVYPNALRLKRFKKMIPTMPINIPRTAEK